MPTVLITGANRGIGLEFARQYAADGWRVLAACRDPEAAADLKAVDGEVSVHRLDVTEPDEIAALAGEIGGAPIDLLLNNAGVYGPRSSPLGGIDYDAWAETLRVNALAPMRIVEAFVDNVAESAQKKIVAITSKMGSMASNTTGGAYIYRSSKAALNAATRSLTLDLARREISVLLLHPGWVRTDMGGTSADVGVEESVTGMRRVIDRLDGSLSGRFFNYDGSEIPW
ncbi:MAG: SDR family oxidoreductase [Alphaproteobacteria bacterium]|nr:SDR family oxidoreductase [Alphaproteobacteria bacterium]